MIIPSISVVSKQCNIEDTLPRRFYRGVKVIDIGLLHIA